MRRRISLTLCILSVCWSYPTDSHADNRRQIDNKDGLSNSAVLSLGQNEQHILFFGTCDGLNIYNGHSIDVYRPTANGKNTLSGNIIEQIVTTRNGITWVMTNNNLNRFDLERGEVTRFPQFTGKLALFKDRHDRLYLYQYTDTLYRYDEQHNHFRPITFVKPPRLTFESLHDIKWDAQDRLWIYLRADKSYCYVPDGDAALRLDHEQSYPSTLRKAFSDGCGELIVDQTFNLFALDSIQGNRTLIVNFKEVMTGRDAINVITRSGDDYYIGFRTTGAIRIARTPDAPAGYTIEDLGLQCGVWSILPDNKQDIVWIGTDGEGVYMYTREKETVRSYLTADLCPQANKPVRALYKDSRNTLWIGTRGAGIAAIPHFNEPQRQAPRYYNEGNSALYDNSVYAFAPGRRNLLWIGSDGGLNYYSYTSGKIETLANPYNVEPLNFIHALCEVNDSTLWIATGGTGVVELKVCDYNGKLAKRSVRRLLHHSAQFTYNYFFSLYRDEQSLLFGNRGYGIFRYAPETDSLRSVYLDPNPNEQTHNEVFDLTKDSAGNLWIATSYGLICQQKNGDINLLEALNRFINSTIHSLQFTATGNLWLGTNKGIVRYNPADGTYQLYDSRSGLEVNEFCDGVSFYDETTRTPYFGGTNGIVTIRENAYDSPRQSFPIHFSDFRISGKTSNMNAYMKPAGDSQTLTLPYDRRFFSIDFSTPDYIYGNSCIFYYRMEPSSDAWMQTDHTLNFTNLRPGHYRLEVKYANRATGTESDVYPLSVHIVPPWYGSPVAYTIYILVALALIVLFIRYLFVRSKRKKEQEIKELEQAHQREVYESKLGFFANIASEFSTPLTLIFGPCDRIIETSPDKNSVRYAKVIRYNAEVLHGLTQEIVTFRSVESRTRQPYIETLDAGELIKKDSLTFVDRAYSHHIHFESAIPAPLQWNSDRFFLRTIVMNLLSYAFRHVNENGRLAIEVEAPGEELHLTFRYDGTMQEEEFRQTIDNHHLLQDFDSLTNIHRSRRRLGMATAHHMTHLLQGTLTATADRGEVTLSIALPSLPLDPRPTGVLNISPEEAVYISGASHPYTDEAQEFDITRQTLFLVGQNKEMRWLLTDLFRETYNLICLAESKEVATQLEEIQPDLIIYDIGNRRKEGPELTRRMKEDKRYAHIPIVLLTNEQNMEEQMKAIQAGAEMCIAKPFYGNYLTTVVAQLIQRRETLKDYFNSPRSAYEKSNAKLIHKEDKKFVEQVLELIYQNMGNVDLSAAFLAEKFNMSPRQLYRKLEEIDKTQSPTELIKECRLKVAQDLLINSKLSIDEVVYKVGYKSRSTFFKNFTAKYHCTPTEFRKQLEVEQS
jgi:ligand-binding sensor domain-containing protein/AraC-like DNA-binding protein